MPRTSATPTRRVTADALARWHRLLGDEVFFLTGTDEHGLKVKRSAEANGLTPQEQADRYSARFREAWELLDISNDDFIRTTEPRHHQAREGLDAGRLRQRLDHARGPTRAFTAWPARRTTPRTTWSTACARCTTGPVELLKEDNYFFRLSAFSDRLLEWYADNPEAVTPEAKRNEAIGLIKGGLQDISVTRTSLDWGVRVPWDEKHVFYVWYDALINYATAVGYGEDEARFEKWWPVVHHLIGKDILRFHCVYWPALCMAAGIDPPHRIAVHGYLLVGGEKMSKTAFNQISPADLVPDLRGGRLPLPFLARPAVRARRRVLLRGDGRPLQRRPGQQPGQPAGPGERRGGAKMRRHRPRPAARQPAGRRWPRRCTQAAAEAWERVAPSEALEATWRLVRAANAALEAAEPWRADPGPAVDAVLGDALEVLRIVAVLASPALTRAPAEIWRRIGLTGSPAGAAAPRRRPSGAGTPAACPVERGRAPFPALVQRLTARPVDVVRQPLPHPL